MSLTALESTINAAFDARDTVNAATKGEVRDAVDTAARTQNHRRSDHGPRQRSASGLVDAGHSPPHADSARAGTRDFNSATMACAARVPAPRRKSA